ncbi:MAG: AraC family transcriptional regulator [Acidobacteriota bacterium]
MLAQRKQPVSRCWFTPDFQFGMHHFRYLADDFRSLPHTHGEHNVVLCLSYSFECVVNGQPVSMLPGDILVVNPGEMHVSNYYSDKVFSEGLTLYITARALDHLVQKMRIPFDGKRQSLRFRGKVQSPKILELAWSLLSEWKDQRAGHEILVQSYVCQILVHMIRNCLEPAIEPKIRLPRQLPSWQMDSAIEYMNTCGKGNFSLRRLSSKLGISTPHFIQLFKNSAATIMPHVYYNKLLVDRARRLLDNTDCSIKEVAYELGFKNDGHFCTLFRSFTGMTPRSYQLRETRSLESR